MKKFLCLSLFIFSIFYFVEFFSWYLSDKKILIEDAMILAIYASLPLFFMIFLTHIFFYPKNQDDHAKVISFPPMIMLFSANLGFLLGAINRYHYQIYDFNEGDIFGERFSKSMKKVSDKFNNKFFKVKLKYEGKHDINLKMIHKIINNTESYSH